MKNEEIRLECLRIAGGDLALAKEYYAFVIGYVSVPATVVSYTAGGGGGGGGR